MTYDNNTKRVRAWLAALALAALPFQAAFAAPFTVTPGTLLAVDYSTRSLIEYAFDGHVNETLSLTGSFSTLSGVQAVGNTVYVFGVNGDVGVTNLNTGAVTRVFQTSGDEGLGSRNGKLLALDYEGSVSEYGLDGTLLNTYAVQGGGTGIDGTGSGFAIASYDDAKVRLYNAAGTFQSGFDTGLNPGEISDLAFDSASNTYWVASGFGRADIRRYSNNGLLLSSFALQYDGINGIDVVPQATSVPEPANLALFGIALAGMSAIRRRAKRR